MARRPLIALLLSAACTLACAQLLSYDDYSVRTARDDAASDATSDVASESSPDVGDAAPAPARMPARPAGSRTPGGGATLWVAVKRMYLGSQTSFGVESPEGWREWGLDLDSVCTSDEDSIKNVGTCRRPDGAEQTALQDGERCRDNNFGQHVVPLIKIANGGFEKILNESILDGTSSTWMLAIEDLGDGPDDAYAPAKLYYAGPTPGRPAWDGTDVRDVRADSVAARDLGKPKLVFDKGFVRDHVWVSDSADFLLPTPLTKHATAQLRLRSGVVSLQLAPDHKGASRGGIAAAIPLATIEDLLLPVASSGGFCPGSSLYDSAARSLLRFPDVVVGAPNLQDETKTCDGISIGIGFEVSPVKPPTTVVDPPIPKPGPCDG